MKALNTLPIGTQARVRSLNLDHDTALRLQALGMIPGTPIKILAKKGKGTMILDLRGTRFALGEKITQNIEVEE